MDFLSDSLTLLQTWTSSHREPMRPISRIVPRSIATWGSVVETWQGQAKRGASSEATKAKDVATAFDANCCFWLPQANAWPPSRPFEFGLDGEDE